MALFDMELLSWSTTTMGKSVTFPFPYTYPNKIPYITGAPMNNKRKILLPQNNRNSRLSNSKNVFIVIVLILPLIWSECLRFGLFVLAIQSSRTKHPAYRNPDRQ